MEETMPPTRRAAKKTTAAKTQPQTEDVKPAVEGDRWFTFAQWLSDEGHGEFDPQILTVAVQKYVLFQKSDVNREFNASRKEANAAKATVPKTAAKASGPPKKAAARTRVV